MQIKIKHAFSLISVFTVPFCTVQITDPTLPQNTITNYPGLYYINSSLPLLQSGINNPYAATMYENNNADGLLMQSNIQAKQMMGMRPPVVPPSDPVKMHEFILAQAKQKNWGNISSPQQHLLDIMNELHNESHTFTAKENLISVESYQKAFTQVNDMLTGKTKLSYADASYYIEATYGNPYMTYKEYKTTISQSAEFIKKWMRQNKMAVTSQSVHYAIQQFMGDTIQVTIALADKKDKSETVRHYPFKYDYEDYEGKADYRNYFSTKCLATGTGQCNSMPIVYLQLCEALEVKGYLTFAPFHSFVKFKDAKGTINNYEPTAHWTIPDKWYQDHLGVNIKAKQTGIYLDTINRKQAVANSLVDLAISYMLRTSKPDTAFVMQCLITAQKYFPKNNNVYVYLAKSSLLSRQLDNALRNHGVKDLKEIKNYADTNNLYTQLIQNENYLSALGYEEMPQSLYDELIQQQKNKTNAPDAKVKKSLFKKIN